MAGSGSAVMLTFYIVLWYALNVAYNIYNKKVLNVFALPITFGTLQLGIGLLYVLPVWFLGLRKAPDLSMQTFKTITPAAAFHTVGHIATVVALGAGSVSFTHIIKASEPIFSTILSALILKEFQPLVVVATLLPVVGGVAYAAMSDLSFTWTSVGYAMLSNLSFATRSIVSKKTRSKLGTMPMSDFYAIMTIISFLAMVPFAVIIEGPQVAAAFAEASDKIGQTELLKQMLFCGLSYYLYNEVAYLALGQLTSVTHAVANTVKRVVIMLAEVVLFSKPMSPRKATGAAVAIGGVLLYSLTKEYYAKKKKSA